MAIDIALSAAVRANLLSLQGTQQLIEQTQNRLSTGLRVSSPLDDARAFFEAKSLGDAAADINEKKEGIDQAISSLTVALEAIDAVDNMVQQMKGIAISSRTATGNELVELVAQFNELRTQIDNMASDANYQGLKLINGTGTTLSVQFSNDTTSLLNIASVDLRSTSLGLSLSSAANFSLSTNITASLTEITSAIDTLRGKAQSLGSNVALLQTRLSFTSEYVNTLEEGAGKLTLADINEEGANLVARQVRQQLGVQALAFAGQSEQSVLQLFN